MGSHSSPEPQSDGFLQMTPGLVGLLQVLVIGLQYALGSLHGDVHDASAVTHTLVIGQQTWPSAQESSAEQLALLGFRQCLASGQQYSNCLQTGLPVGGEHGSCALTHSFEICEHDSPLSQSLLLEQKIPGLVGAVQCLRSPSQYVALFLHGEVQAAPGMTHTFVRGQQTWPSAQDLPLAQDCLVGSRQRFASGQQ